MERKFRTEAHADLGKMAKNVGIIQSYIAEGSEMIAVVKDDAYGHGIAGIYPTLEACGIKRYAVGFWQEGKALRDAGCPWPIHLLSDTMDSELEKAVEYDLYPAIFSLDAAVKLNEAAGRAGKVCGVDITFDTGMNRIGFKPSDEALEDVRKISELPNLRIVAAHTHFANADEEVSPRTEKQFGLYMDMIARLGEMGIEVPYKHVSNSACAILRPEMHLDGVRAGDIIYGLPPFEDKLWYGLGLEETLTWNTYVGLVKTVPAGAEIGYGGTHVTDRETVVATIPVGFGDGFSRQLSNKGFVTIRGQKAPIIGTVTMDGFMADVTDIDGVVRGDEVTLLGGEMNAKYMAEFLGITPDEVVCGINSRVPRIYD